MSRDHDRPHVIAALGKASFYGLTNYPQAPLKNEEASIERLLLADCVEKVLSSIGANFLRATGALGHLERGGPLRLERIHAVAFPHALKGYRYPKSAVSSISREFFRGDIFDFFNTIGAKRSLESARFRSQSSARRVPASGSIAPTPSSA